jgi:hypothetical protein
MNTKPRLLLAAFSAIGMAVTLTGCHTPATKPLVKFIESDEDGDVEVIGDFLTRRPSILTDATLIDFDSPGDRLSRFQGGLTGYWGDFEKWAEEQSGQKAPLLIAFGRWLAIRHGQEQLLPLCDNLAAKWASVKQA